MERQGHGAFAAGAEPMDATERLLEQLTNAPGASGFEYPVRNLLSTRWKGLGASVKADGFGNLIANLGAARPTRPTVLIMAHMDEVGFMATEILEGGFIKAQPLGGWLTHVLWGHAWRIQVGEKRIPAISGIDSPHVLKDFTTTPKLEASQLFFDTGLTRKELLALGVRPGLPITPDVSFRVAVPGRRYMGKAFDDRVGLALMTELMAKVKQRPERFSHLNVLFAATVQEELGMRGALALASTVKPDVTLNLEAGIARDYPTQFAQGSHPELGKGPAVFVFDGSMVPNPRLVTFIRDVATRHAIPFQWASEGSYGQDASRLQTAFGGSMAVNLGIPIRYAHSHNGLMDRHDYDQMMVLLEEVLTGLTGPDIEAMR